VSDGDNAGSEFAPVSAAIHAKRFAKKKMRILISGGPGSGCTSTALALGELLGIPVFDSDAYFHKPTDPPFQEQYTPEERRELLNAVLASESSWILSGSVATWGVSLNNPTHGIFLDPSKESRLNRLGERQRSQFGRRIDFGGDMQQEHESFMEWAAGYDDRTGVGRNSITDQKFLVSSCEHFLSITGNVPFQEVVSKITNFLNNITDAEQIVVAD